MTRPGWCGRALMLLAAFLIPLRDALPQPAKPAEPAPASAAAAKPAEAAFPDVARLVSLPRMTESQIREFVADAIVYLELTARYRRAGQGFKLELPALPERVALAGIAYRAAPAQTDVIRFGYVLHPRRLPQLWIQAVSVAPGGAVVANPDGEAKTLDPILGGRLAERSKALSQLRLVDLDSRVLKLSYIDADSALFTLRAMGYSAITDEDALARDTSYRGDDIELLKGFPDGS